MMDDSDIATLEEALLERAERLANEYISRAENEKIKIIEEENERLHLREEREVLTAKAKAERLYRRKTQAEEINLKEKMDQLRWQLVQSVKYDMLDRLQNIAADEQRYLPFLSTLASRCADAIHCDELEIQLNERDHSRLKDNWQTFIEKAAPKKIVHLKSEPCHCTGGLIMRSNDNRIRIDATFEGRIERFEDDIHQIILERLFSQTTDIGGLVHG